MRGFNTDLILETLNKYRSFDVQRVYEIHADLAFDGKDTGIMLAFHLFDFDFALKKLTADLHLFIDNEFERQNEFLASMILIHNTNPVLFNYVEEFLRKYELSAYLGYAIPKEAIQAIIAEVTYRTNLELNLDDVLSIYTQSMKLAHRYRTMINDLHFASILNQIQALAQQKKNSIHKELEHSFKEVSIQYLRMPSTREQIENILKEEGVLHSLPDGLLKDYLFPRANGGALGDIGDDSDLLRDLVCDL